MRAAPRSCKNFYPRTQSLLWTLCSVTILFQLTSSLTSAYNVKAMGPSAKLIDSNRPEIAAKSLALAKYLFCFILLIYCLSFCVRLGELGRCPLLGSPCNLAICLSVLVPKQILGVGHKT